MKIADLQAFGASRDLIEALSAAGLVDLYPPQVLAVQAGLLSAHDSFVISAPTASGKTLIAEMAAVQAFLQKQGRVIYTVPLRALAREKYDHLSGMYGKIGMRILQSTGDFDKADPWLGKADLIITTNEKLDSLLRHRAPWFEDVGLVVVDEVHLIGDSRRGPVLEIVLTRLRQEMPGIRVIALSATIPNAGELAEWLKARLVVSDWRPVLLREGVYFDGAVIFNDGTVTWIPEESGVNAVDLAVSTIREGGQALLFVNTRRAAEAAAHKAASAIKQILTDRDQRELAGISEQVLSGSEEPTRLSRKLSALFRSGVAFHHAGILSSDRRAIEDAFRQSRIKFLAATTTLAMGLNLPSRRVIIRDWRRYQSGSGMALIPIMEMKQMAGRAGRPGFDVYGEAVLVASNRRDEQVLFERYIKGRPENVLSRLGSESSLRTHILASIAGGFSETRNDLIEFLQQTLYAFQGGLSEVIPIADGILEFLLAESLVTEDGTLTATRFGRRVSELYINPASAVLLKRSLDRDAEKTCFGLLHMIAHTPDMPRLSLKQSDIDRMLGLFAQEAGHLLVPLLAVPTESMLAEVKLSALLSRWIDEAAEDDISSEFGVGPGDIHSFVDMSDWLLYAASQIAHIFRLEAAEKALEPLRVRVRYGVKEELLPLVSLRGIGRKRARSLFDAGYKTVRDIQAADVRGLEAVPSIGRTVALDLKKQADGREAA